MNGDIEAFAALTKSRDVPCTARHDEPWGQLVTISLPGASEMGVYQPKHAGPTV